MSYFIQPSSRLRKLPKRKGNTHKANGNIHTDRDKDEDTVGKSEKDTNKMKEKKIYNGLET